MDTHYAGDDPFANTALGNALTRAIVDTIHEPFLVLDTDLRVIVASRSFYKKFHMEKADVQGKLLYDLAGGTYNIPALRHFLQNIIPEHAVLKEYKLVHTFAPIGELTLLLSAREVEYENSTRKHLLLTMGDVTGQEMLEQEKEKLSRQKDLMITEMKHRMANSLQLIASILILKSESVESPEVRGHLQDAHERILSIANVEKYLDATSLTEEVEVGPYLTSLCESLARSMISPTRNITLSVIAPGGMTTAGSGISLGLITAELVINCLRHGFPTGRGGSIVVSYLIEPHGWCLSVVDDGVGMAADASTKKGLGTTIVRSLAEQLGAVVEVVSSVSGTSVFIRSDVK